MRKLVFTLAVTAVGWVGTSLAEDTEVVRTQYRAISSTSGLGVASNWEVYDTNKTAWVTASTLDYQSGEAVFTIVAPISSTSSLLAGELPANEVFHAYGIKWYRNWGTFQINAPSAGGSSLAIGAGGMNMYQENLSDRGYVIKVPITLASDQVWRIHPATAYLEINSSVSGEGKTLTLSGAGVKNFGTSDTSRGYQWARTILTDGTMVLRNRANVLPSDHELVFSGTNAAASATLNVTAFDHELKNALWCEAPGTCANNTLTSSGAASKNSIVFTGAPQLNPTGFGGRLLEGAGLTWRPEAATSVFVFSNAVSTTQGKISVENGTVRVADGAAFTALQQVSVGATGRFEALTTCGGISATSLDVAEGGKVKVEAGVKVVFDSIFFNGATVASGTHTSKTDSWIEGDGSVVVAGTSWTAGGSDAAIDKAQNWGGVEPDLESGNFTGIFAASGSHGLIPSTLNAIFRALVFKGANDFTIDAEEGGNLTVKEQGIQTEGGSSARTWTVKSPLTVSGDQFWSVGGKDKMIVSNVVSGSSCISKDGTGELHLYGKNTFTGRLKVLNGRVWAHSDDAFGSTAGTTELTQSKGYVTLDGITTHENFVLTKGFNAFEVPKGKVSHVYGLMDNPNGGNWGLTTSGDLYIHGGAYGSGNFGFKNLHVCDKPLHLTDRFSASSSIYLNVASNWVGNNHTLMYGGCEIHCQVPYAYYRGPRSEQGYGSLGKTVKATYISRIQFSSTGKGIFDLGGFDQETCQLFCNKANSTMSCVTSAASAQLHLYCDRRDGLAASDAMAQNYVKFAGAAGFTVDRFSNYAMTFLSVSSTTGRLEIADSVEPSNAASKLTIGTTGGWPNASEVRVTGGTLAFTHSASIGKKTDVYIDGRKGVLQLDNLEAQKCRWLFVWNEAKNDYVRLFPDVYGGSTCSSVPEANRLPCLSGNGVLNVLGQPGFRVIVR